MLFGGISLSPRHWLLALDGKLFETPLGAALVNTAASAPTYLAEQVTLESVPGAWAVGANPETLHTGPFLGLGDPIYNTADDRLRPDDRRQIAAPAFFGSRGTSMQLPRLVGSAAELTECSRRWTGTPILLTGLSSTGDRFRAALGEHPSVIHIAAHFVRGGDDENRAVIALTLRAGIPGGSGSGSTDSGRYRDDARQGLAGGVKRMRVWIGSCSGWLGPARPCARLACRWRDLRRYQPVAGARRCRLPFPKFLPATQ